MQKGLNLNQRGSVMWGMLLIAPLIMFTLSFFQSLAVGHTFDNTLSIKRKADTKAFFNPVMRRFNCEKTLESNPTPRCSGSDSQSTFRLRDSSGAELYERYDLASGVGFINMFKVTATCRDTTINGQPRQCLKVQKKGPRDPIQTEYHSTETETCCVQPPPT